MKHTTLCYLEKDGASLMMHRVKKKNDENHDKWVGIGGHLEFGESPFDCVRRETREETGLTLRRVFYRGIITFIQKDVATEYMHLFTSADFDGKMSGDCGEGVLEWVRKEDVPSLPIWEGDRIFLSLLDREKRFFSLKLVYDGDRLIGQALEFAQE